ncbi:hypothetical protein EDC01DRAFT_98983 [Geopyxis carbonaria]|nr:hypothetical protein EDC01DRAFT_98983 [Geopyxis carbonaria]
MWSYCWLTGWEKQSDMYSQRKETLGYDAVLKRADVGEGWVLIRSYVAAMGRRFGRRSMVVVMYGGDDSRTLVQLTAQPRRCPNETKGKGRGGWGGIRCGISLKVLCAYRSVGGVLSPRAIKYPPRHTPYRGRVGLVTVEQRRGHTDHLSIHPATAYYVELQAWGGNQQQLCSFSAAQRIRYRVLCSGWPDNASDPRLAWGSACSVAKLEADLHAKKKGHPSAMREAELTGPFFFCWPDKETAAAASAEIMSEATEAIECNIRRRRALGLGEINATKQS